MGGKAKAVRRGSWSSARAVEVRGCQLLPPPPGVCQTCAVAHAASHPHDAQSLYYQTHFSLEHGRPPTWHDALAHCNAEMKAFWLRELARRGVDVNRGPA